MCILKYPHSFIECNDQGLVTNELRFIGESGQAVSAQPEVIGTCLKEAANEHDRGQHVVSAIDEIHSLTVVGARNTSLLRQRVGITRLKHVFEMGWGFVSLELALLPARLHVPYTEGHMNGKSVQDG